MKIIFLDFDGVLNSEKYLHSCGQFGVVLDPSRLILLEQTVKATGAQIVLSSSWREHWGQTLSACDETGITINKIFNEHGLKVFDKTPKLGTRREQEIAAWLKNHPEPENFVVLDDAFLSADFLNGHFVKTSNIRPGLDENDVAKAILILNINE